MTHYRNENSLNGYEIAVLGMSIRGPSVNSVDEYWRLLAFGREGFTTFSREELLAAGVPETQIDDPNYVKRVGLFKEKNVFDAPLFHYSPREAELLDPQIAVLHHCIWEALEQAGYDSHAYADYIGLYAGIGDNFEWRSRILDASDTVSEAYGARTLTGTGYLTSRNAFKFNLRGPVVSVQTACSTSLVAVHAACQALLAFECDMALAGGVTLSPVGATGYLHQEGMILSADGHCRPFDADSSGIVGAEGAGVLVLKRLKDAMADRDNVLAVIKGTAINNDGNRDKASFSAPSVTGQANVIKAALDVAEVAPAAISYVEAHGTATRLGDPIEIKALTKAFGSEAIQTNGKQYCKIGSVKSNIGHLDTAAGVAGVIKTILAMRHKQIPASLNVRKINPLLDLKNTPFTVNTELNDWVCNNGPRRAGVSSFGIGGTNAHIVLEEPTFKAQTGESRQLQLVFLSANSPNALKNIEQNLLAHINKCPTVKLADLCFTLHQGRKPLPHRKALAVQRLEELRQALSQERPSHAAFSGTALGNNKICFLFPGQGSQYIEMGKGLYESEPVFRKWMDKCFAIARQTADIDLKSYLFPEQVSEQARAELNQTAITQPLLFSVEYSLAQLLMHWGCQPDMMIGHSVGEYVAACLADVFSLDAGMALITQRGALVQSLPPGAMLAVFSTPATIERLLRENHLSQALDIAAVNAPGLLVVSGGAPAIDDLQAVLNGQRIDYAPLHTSHAFHSHHLDPVLEDFKMVLESVALSPPKIPYVSNLTGEFVTAEQTTSPDYWLQHLRRCVQFSKGVEVLCAEKELTFLEVGPGKVLSNLIAQNPQKSPAQECIALLPDSAAKHNAEVDNIDQLTLCQGLCRLFTRGTSLNWDAFYAEELRGRIPLPTYPFEGKAYWTPGLTPAVTEAKTVAKGKNPDLSQWFYVPRWRPQTRKAAAKKEDSPVFWLVFEDSCQFGEGLFAAMNTLLSQAGNGGKHNLIRVRAGESFARLDEQVYQIAPHQESDYLALLKTVSNLVQEHHALVHVVHLWSIYPNVMEKPLVERFAKAQCLGFFSLVYLARALTAYLENKPAHISIVTNDLLPVSALSPAVPEKSGVLGINKVLSQEYKHLSSRVIDVHQSGDGDWETEIDFPHFLTELSSPNFPSVAAVRNRVVWTQTHEPLTLAKPAKPTGLREKGVYLITGGLGRIGMKLTATLATQYQARMILTSRSAFPPRSEWGHLASQAEATPVREKIKMFLRLEQQGARIDVLQADISDKQETDALFQWIAENVGNVHGVLHAAAEIEVGLIEEITPLESAKYYAAKVQGIENLSHCLRDMPIDFCLVFSSIATLLGGLGFANYAAANYFMDNFVQQLPAEQRSRWLCVNWDGWNFKAPDSATAVAANNPASNKLAINKSGSAIDQYTFTPDEGMEAFRRLLGLRGVAPQVVVSTGDLTQRYRTYVHESFRVVAGKGADAATPHGRPELSTPYVAPTTELETKLATLWAEKLKLDRIGVADNLYELGVDSLILISMVAHIKQRLSVPITNRELLGHNTIAEQAKILAAKGGAAAFEPESMQKAPAATDVPLSYVQQLYWAPLKIPGLENASHMAEAMILAGEIDFAALKKAIQCIIDRHESLRLRIAENDRGAFLVTDKTVTFEFEEISLATLAIPALQGRRGEEIDEYHLRRILSHKLKEPFDFDNGPLIKGYLLRLSDKKYALMLDIHHLSYDGWSIRLFRKELKYFYEVFCKGEVANLPPMELQYSDYAWWQQQLHKTEKVEKQLQYWRRELSDYPGDRLFPTDFPRETNTNFHMGFREINLPRDLFDQISRYAKDNGMTIFTCLVAAFHVACYCQSGMKEMISTSPIIDRHDSRLQDAIGFYVNFLPVRSKLDESKTLEEFIKQIWATAIEGQKNADVHVKALIDDPAIEANRHQLLSGLLLNHLKYPHEQDWRLPGVDVTRLPLDLTQTCSFTEVALEVIERSTMLESRLFYMKGLFTSETMDCVGNYFERTLQAIVKCPTVTIQTLFDSYRRGQTRDPAYSQNV